MTDTKGQKAKNRHPAADFLQLSDTGCLNHLFSFFGNFGDGRICLRHWKVEIGMAKRDPVWLGIMKLGLWVGGVLLFFRFVMYLIAFLGGDAREFWLPVAGASTVFLVLYTKLVNCLRLPDDAEIVGFSQRKKWGDWRNGSSGGENGGTARENSKTNNANIPERQRRDHSDFMTKWGDAHRHHSA